MWALGTLFIWILYFIFSIPPLIALYLLLSRNKNGRPHILLLSLTLLPILGLWYSEHSKVKQEEEKFVGEYLLTNYPGCYPCYLNLNENNRYNVTGADSILEEGRWKIEMGSDYYNLKIGNERLGSGRFEYESDNNPFQ